MAIKVTIAVKDLLLTDEELASCEILQIKILGKMDQ